MAGVKEAKIHPHQLIHNDCVQLVLQDTNVGTKPVAWLLFYHHQVIRKLSFQEN